MVGLDQVITQGPLAVVAAAVTPVVMISATAILIGGVSAKHQSLSDRLRALTAEYRLPETSDHRKAGIRTQLRLFRRRVRYVTLAHLGLYLAVACFIGMVMVISLSPMTGSGTRLTLPMFISGVLLLLGAVVSEVLELLLASRTLELEEDLLPDK